MQDYYLIVFRMLMSVCIAADAIWYLVEYETRVLHFRHVGLKDEMIYLLVAVYIFFAIR